MRQESVGQEAATEAAAAAEAVTFHRSRVEIHFIFPVLTDYNRLCTICTYKNLCIGKADKGEVIRE